MAGISHVLNIAKEALQAQQTSINVTSHNVANVNTPGYTKQRLDLTAAEPTPEKVGYIGGGVKGQEVSRLYDQFITDRIMDQESTLKNIDSQMEMMKTVETSFNEAPGMALNELMSEFWNSWQTLTNDPENSAARQSVVQKGEVVIGQLHSMHSELVQNRYDTENKIEAAVQDVNSLTSQIADLNGRITSSESETKQINDLRDKRDSLVKELSGFLDINYFEDRNGAYTVTMKDGHSLVESKDSWEISWSDNKLNWITESSDGSSRERAIASGEELGGKMGGWMEVHNQLIPNQPENYMGRLNSLAESMIREVNQIHSQGVGTVRFDDELVGTEKAADTARLDATINTATSTESIKAGDLTINGREVGEIKGGVVDNGRAKGKAYNSREAINEALTGAGAKLTTQVAGEPVTDMDGSEEGNNINFTINGIEVDYEVKSGDTAPGTLAENIRDAINDAIEEYNNDPANAPEMTLEAVVGDGDNGGADNSIVLQNTEPGDESRIVIDGIETETEQKLGLTDGEYTPDTEHNTGSIHLFAREDPLKIDSGPDDSVLAQLGLGGGGHSASDEGGDGELEYKFSDGGVEGAMNGLAYAEELQKDGGSFKIWLYNKDDTLAQPQPVEVSIERAYQLKDVAEAIETSIKNATGESDSWIKASVKDNQLVLEPEDSDHKFAFGGDNSNFLAAAGINTFFKGHDAGNIETNEQVADNLEHLAAGQVDDDGQIFKGDSENALAISNIREKEAVHFTGSSDDSLDGHYNNLVADIGSKTRTLERDQEHQQLVSNQLNELRDATSGVSLDEEMSNLIKFQHAYSAASKLISTSDEMLRNLLETV
ncbi:MAG: flagellar hook-associated protein FlgK [Desulfurivibrionaceae bacterium]